MALTAKQRHWANHLQQADAFDGSMADYARSQGLSPKALYQWRSILKQRTVASSLEHQIAFTEVIAQPTAVRSTLTLMLGSAQLQFDQLPDEAWLVRLIAAHD